jgi:hypothetical protein
MLRDPDLVKGWDIFIMFRNNLNEYLLGGGGV